MMGIAGVCYRLIGDLMQAFRVSRLNSTQINADPEATKAHSAGCIDDLAARALKAVFGMDNNGRIKKEKARRVVEKLGLIYSEDEKECSFDLPGGLDDDEVRVEEVLCGLEEDGSKLLREAFKIFDEDGNGFIEARELKRVLDCLGLDYGWDMGQIEKMVRVVDLNLDGKVDFGEFELMMGGENC